MAEGTMYQCEIHDFETDFRGEMQQHIDYEHPGGAAKESVNDFLIERYQGCEECAKPVDTQEAGTWKAPNDEQWWHEGCYDKIEKTEEIAQRIRRLVVPEGRSDGLSGEFHTHLENAQASLETAVEQERLKQDQRPGHGGASAHE